jgi:hypothetical protein
MRSTSKAILFRVFRAFSGLKIMNKTLRILCDSASLREAFLFWKLFGFSFLEFDESAMIRVILPHHLRTLAHAGAEVQLEVEGPVTIRSVLDAIEVRYPMLAGTIRDHVTQQRRPFLRYFACQEDLSLEPPDMPLPDAIVSGTEPFIILGAIAGG